MQKPYLNLLKSLIIISGIFFPFYGKTQCTINTIPESTGGCGIDHIDYFELDGIPAVGNSGCSNGTYQEFTFPVWNLEIGETYNWEGIVATLGQSMAIWIDLNNDGILDSTEFMGSTPSALTHSGSFTIPAGTVPANNVRMRVRCRYATAQTADDACLVYSYGETEDYFVNLYIPAPCSGTPDAGVATPTKNQVCQAEAFDINLTGYSLVTGLNFQWESAPSAGGPWAAVSGANSSSVSLSQSSDTWYRCLVTCTSSNQTDTSNVVGVNTLLSLSAGTYTIGTGGNYMDFSDAVNALSCGITGPVFFNVLPGTYNEQIIIKEIPGTSATNTVIFKGTDPATTKIIFEQNFSNDRYTIRFDGSSWVTLDSLTIEADAAGEYGWPVHINPNTSDITIKNCFINSDTTSTSTFINGIVASGSNTGYTTGGTGISNILIENNVINGGYTNISLTGLAASRITGVEIKNNILRNAHYTGIYLSQNEAPLITGNEIDGKTSGTTTGAGIWITTVPGPFLIEANTITNAGQYGIYITASAASAANTSKIVNNSIGGGFRNTSNLAGGIRMLGTTNYIDVHNNSFNFDGQSGSALNVRVTTVTNLDIRNNSFVYSGGDNGYAMYLNSTTANANTLNFNNYFSNGTHFVYYGADRADLSALIAVNSPGGNDINSISENPFYNSPFYLLPSGGELYQKGTPIAGINTDINGSPRDPVTPDIGAYNIPVCVSPPTAGSIVAPNLACTGEPVFLSLDGNTIGAGLTYQWQSSPSGTTGPWNNIPGADSPGFDTVQTASTWYRAILTCGGVSDTTSPIEVIQSIPISGVFTIDATQPQSATNFPSFTDVVNTLNCAGIDGPVTINVAAGTYNEQIILEEIAGASATNTVTFRGADPATTKIIFEQNVSDDRYTIRFDGSSWVTIDSLTIEADAAGTYGWPVHINPNTSDITIKNCFINSDTTSTSTFINGIVASGSNTGYTTGGSDISNILIENNVINGGYNNIRLNGLAASRITGVEIKNNILKNAHYTGIFLSQNEAPVISGNEIDGKTSGTTTGAGIWFTTVPGPFMVEANNITNAGMYGIYITGSAASAANTSKIVNNAIGGGNRNTTINAGGIRILGTTNYIDLHHNSLNFDGTLGSALNVRVNTVTNLDIRNNSFVYSGGDNGYAMYLNSITANANTLDFNNYFSNGSNFVYYASARTDLIDLQTVNSPAGNDLNSVSGDPFYTTSLSLKPLGPILDSAGTPIASVPNDITGQPRSTSAPDIGAYEYDPLPGDLALTDGGIDRQNICYNTNDTVFLTVKNIFGSTVDFSVNPLVAHWTVTGPVNSSGTISHNFGTLPVNSSVNIFDINADLSQPGVYTLNAFLDTNAINPGTFNDTLNPSFEITVHPIVEASPKVTTVTSPYATPDLNATSPLFPGGGFFITEVCQFKTPSGAPTGGWPSYLSAGDYIEITGIPNSDLEGITLEQWNASSMLSTHTFPQGTVLSPNGTAIIAVGEMGISVPSPSNFYYHGNGNFTGDLFSDVPSGRILKDANGNIIDAVGYSGNSSYTFPAAAGVTAADWSGNTPIASSTSGNRLEGPYTKNANNWINSSTSPQDPNALNNNVMIPVQGTVTGFTWSYMGTVIDTVPRTPVGPFTNIDTLKYIASYNSACGFYTDTAYVVVNLTNVQPMVNNISCFGAGDGSITAVSTGGDAPYTYAWAHDTTITSATITDLEPGVYVVTITDDNQWPATDTIIISEPAELTATFTIVPEYCETSPGSITVNADGGTPVYQYDWNTGHSTATADSLKAGAYTVVLSDANNCTVTLTDTIPLELFTATVSDVTNVKCFGEYTGEAKVVVSGGNLPYDFDWSNGLDSSIATGLAAGTYYVTVTDMSGCTGMDTVIITEPTEMIIGVQQTDASCFGIEDGEVVVEASGGIPPYSFSLTQPQTTGVFTGLSAGEYTIIISDSNNCEAIEDVTIGEPDEINNNVIVNELSLTAELGNAMYQWIDCDDDNKDIEGAISQNFTATSNGSYAVRIKVGECEVTSECHEIQGVGINSYNAGTSLMVYPNPNNGRFIIETDKEGDFTLVNGIGQTVQKIQVNAANNFKAEISGVSTGVYYLIGMKMSSFNLFADWFI